jgi:hypothetical protein
MQEEEAMRTNHLLMMTLSPEENSIVNMSKEVGDGEGGYLALIVSVIYCSI